MYRALSLLLVLAAVLTVPAVLDAAPPEPHDPVEITAVSNWQETILFYVIAAVTIVSAIGVATSGNVIRMATFLFATFGGVALLFFLLQAHFVAVVQLIVYVGGILVLIIFGIMLTSSSPWIRFEVRKFDLLASGAVCVALFALLAYLFGRADWGGTAQTANPAMAWFGETLLGDFLVPFEIVGVLLLVVMVGAAYLAMQEKVNR